MMTQQWTVLCDNDKQDDRGHVCCASDQVSGTKAYAAKEFKRVGWRRKKGEWYCPDCAQELIKPTPL